MLDRLAREAPRFFTLDIAAYFAQAAATTLLLTLVGCGVGLLAGAAIAYARRSTGALTAPLRAILTGYVQLFRRVPFIVVLFLALYTIEAVAPGAPLFLVAVVAICLMSSAFMAEIARAGFESVPRPQLEAASTLNMSRWQATRLVVLPQAWRVILPPAASFCVMFVKDTSLASTVGVFELMFAGKILNNRGFSPLLVYGTVLILYFALSAPLARLGAWLERRLAPRARAAPHERSS